MTQNRLLRFSGKGNLYDVRLEFEVWIFLRRDQVKMLF
jgi:hypothetical protein